MAKSKKTATDILEPITPHEEMPHNPAVETLTPSFAEKAKTEIAKFNFTRSAIAELKKQYSGLTIAGVEDKKGYEAVRQARGVVRSKRTALEAKRKELVADYLATQRAINDEAKDLTALVVEIEQPLEDELKRIDDERERLDREEKEREEKVLQDRVNALLEAGLHFTGNYYSIGDTIALDVVTIKNLSDFEFDGLLGRVNIEAEKIHAAEAAENLRKENELKQLEEQKQENARRELELQQQAEAQERERQEIINERRILRASQIEALGLSYSLTGGNSWNIGGQTIISGDIGLMDAEGFKSVFASLREAVGLEKQYLEFREQQTQRINTRSEEMQAMGFKYSGGRFFIQTESYGDSNFYSETVLNLDEAEWNKHIKEASQLIAETRRQDAEQKEKLAMIKLREAELKGLGFEFSLHYNGWKKPVFEKVLGIKVNDVEEMDALGWSERIGSIKTNIANIEAEKEVEAENLRVARLSDTDKVREYLAKVNASLMDLPVINDNTLKSYFGGFLNSVSDAQKYFENQLKSL